MPKGITVQEASERLADAGRRLSDRYIRGASGKGSRWASGAKAGERNYADGVTAALSRGAFGKGVDEAGAGAYDEGVRSKGETNYSTGMQTAGPKYTRKTQKYAGLWNQPLATPKGSRRSAANRKRMEENISRFEKAKA